MSHFADDLADWRPVAVEARTLWRAAGLAVVGLVVGVGWVAAAVAGETWVVGAVSALGVGAGTGWWRLVGRRWAAWGYAERDADLLIRRGVLVQRLTIVPYGRMQFVDLAEGPLARRMGIARVDLHTAAAATDASIPPLRRDEARRLRDRLAELGETRAAGL